MITEKPDRKSAAHLHLGENAPQICVCIDTSEDWGRNVVRGIHNYSVKHDSWCLTLQPQYSIADDTFDGAIGFLDRENAARISQNNKAVVNLFVSSPSPEFPTVTSNHQQAAKMAIAHFAKHGIKNFGYVGPLTENIVANHAGAFEDELTGQGFACHVFDSRRMCAKDPEAAKWFAELPKPIGIFTWNASVATDLISFCRNQKINVPDEVAILSGCEDELRCSTCSPTVSSIQTAAVQIGYEAARHLHAQLRGDIKVASVMEVTPVMVIERESTSTLAIDDPELLAAVQYIRMHACNGISVQKVSDAISIGRRSLERKFKENFGCTPLDEIQRLRMARVRELLIQTDLPVSKIAKDAGFGTPEYMTTMFKSRFGQTPLKFRSNSRAR